MDRADRGRRSEVGVAGGQWPLRRLRNLARPDRDRHSHGTNEFAPVAIGIVNRHWFATFDGLIAALHMRNAAAEGPAHVATTVDRSEITSSVQTSANRSAKTARIGARRWIHDWSFGNATFSRAVVEETSPGTCRSNRAACLCALSSGEANAARFLAFERLGAIVSATRAAHARRSARAACSAGSRFAAHAARAAARRGRTAARGIRRIWSRASDGNCGEYRGERQKRIS